MARSIFKTSFLGLIAVSIFMACAKTSDNNGVQPTLEKPLPSLLYVRAGGSAVMNVAAFMPNVGQMTVAKDALNGSVSFDEGKFIRYAPKAGITEGSDNFSVNINGSETPIKVVVMAATTTVCEAGAMLDKTISNMNTPVSIDVLANDKFCAGVNASTLRIVSQPINGSLAVNGSTLTFTPKRDFVGLDKAIYTVSGRDSAQLNSSAEVYFIITNPNLCQIMLNPQYLKWSPTTAEPTLTIDVITKNTLCNLPKSSLFISSTPQYGTARIANDKIIYTPSSTTPTTKTEVISYAFRDSLGTTYNSFVQIDPSICTPKILADYAEWTVSATAPSFTIDVLANDTLCTASTLGINTQPMNGQATFPATGGRGIIYTPNANFRGLDAFLYNVRDAAGVIYTGAVKVKVN
jgi:large repetitive protein